MTINKNNHQPLRQQLENLVSDAFIRHAIDNSGRLTSPRRGPQTAVQVCNLAWRFLIDETDEAELIAITTKLAEQGLALVTATAMMQALNQADWPETINSAKLAEFQLRFLGTLAENREYVHRKTQERSQLALQQALHNQLEQQRRLHQAQEQHNRNLNQILQLNARLASITNEPALLMEAVQGIRQALNLTDATIYQYHENGVDWPMRASTIEPFAQVTRPQDAELLKEALSNNDGFFIHFPTEQDEDLAVIAIILRLSGENLGGIVVSSEHLDEYGYDDFPILIRTFAQNLASLWRNLALFTETRQRAKELEILHGRYVDTIWNSETAALTATFSHNNLQLDSAPPETPGSQIVPVHIGGQPFGQLTLPPTDNLSQTDVEFAHSLIRVMSNALNNARLLQTARAFSNQLRLAAEVSRAATTILDRDQLIQEVVELIRARFNYYYVGLFLIGEDGETAVLQAGTGEAGRLQVEAGHTLPLNGTSMVSAAISKGEAHAEQDVRLAKAFHRNPLLPETRAELTVPLRTRGIITGALTIQSNKIGIFAQETIDVLQALADQLAVAIVNASLFARVQANLDETHQLYEASRHINAAQTAVEVYQALIDYARESNLAQAAYIITAAPNAPDFLTTPVLWSQTPIPHNPQERFPLDKFHFGPEWPPKTLILTRRSQTDERLGNVIHRLARTNNLHALALIPVQVEGEWLATLALHRTTITPFSEAELQPFLTLVDQSAVILSNQQLLKQAETLYQVGQSLSQALTRDDALDIAVQQVAQYTGAWQCRFVLYNEQITAGSIMAEFHSAKPYTVDLIQTARFPTHGDAVFERLNAELKPLLVDEESGFSTECLNQYVYQFGGKASLLIPATSQHELIGFLSIDSRQGRRPFTQANTIFAQTVVDHLTTQIENLNLLDEALSRAQELITLNQIQAGVSGILDLTQLAQTVHDEIGRLLDNTIFILARYYPDTHEYSPILMIREGKPVADQPHKVREGSPLHQLLFGQRPLIADQNNPIMQPSLLPGQKRAPQSSLWIPLLQENQPTGFISLQAYEPRRYTETDVQLLRSIATHTSLAIANAQLFEEIQASNAKLRQLDHLKTQFLANMSHELRTPLNSIIGFSRVILKGIDGPLTQAQTEDLTSIYDNGQHLLALINEILDMAKIEAGKMSVSFDSVDLVHVAHMALETARSLVNEDKVQLIDNIDPNTPPIEADPVRLRQILNNLLSNAVKFTNAGHIRLSVKRQEDHVLIVVEDTGIGIAEKDYERLFQPFEQIENRQTRVIGGTGLGLPITRWLVTTHNGRIWLNSHPGQGSAFHILLPLTQPEDSPTEISISDSRLDTSKNKGRP